MSESLIIDIKDANVYLSRNLVLKNINWQVKEGEHCFILGANGAGKTTLVKTLMGYTWPVFGAQVNVLGHRYGTVNLSEVRKQIAWVSPFMQRWTSSEWTALQMVISGIDGTLGLFRDPTEQEIEKAMAIMQKLDCDKLAEHNLDAMSSGEQVKILICRALMHEPRLMILDEACVHLDFKSREFLLDTIDELAKKEDSPTILFITQRIEDILPSFETGMILNHGCIQVEGKRDDILTEENLFQAYGMHIELHKNSAGRMWPVIA